MLGACDLVAFVPTRNAATAKRFYQETLGLTFVNDDGFAVVFDAHGVTVRVVKVPEYTPFAFTLLGWRVADIETQHRQLEAHGVTFERFGLPDQDPRGIWTAPGGARVAWFKDPDGNLLSISQQD